MTKRVDDFLRGYDFDPRQVDVEACARAFQADMERGLRAALACLTGRL